MVRMIAWNTHQNADTQTYAGVQVVLTGADLFTSNTSYLTASMLEGHTGVYGLLRSWIISYFSNLFGAVLLVWMVLASDVYESNPMVRLHAWWYTAAHMSCSICHCALLYTPVHVFTDFCYTSRRSVWGMTLVCPHHATVVTQPSSTHHAHACPYDTHSYACIAAPAPPGCRLCAGAAVQKDTLGLGCSPRAGDTVQLAGQCMRCELSSAARLTIFHGITDGGVSSGHGARFDGQVCGNFPSNIDVHVTGL